MSASSKSYAFIKLVNFRMRNNSAQTRYIRDDVNINIDLHMESQDP